MEINNNYLVIFSAHVDSENKRDETIETLKHLKESNIDVCLSTHSNLYLDELSQYVKYVVYDNNNEFLMIQDYVDNCNHIKNSFEFGYSESKTFHNFGHVSIKTPCSPHSKSALLLVKNGVILSELKGYKWTIYLEYDIKIPNLGFKHFFDYHINKLLESGKKCFYYENKLKDESFISLWGGPFVFETNSVFNHKKFIKNDWYSNNKNWIEEWYLGFFESILDRIINDVFTKNEIIVEIIQENYKKFWDVDNFYQIGKFNYKDGLSNNDKYLKNSFRIHLYPNIDNDGNKKLFLYYYNSGDIKINIKQILVYSNNVLHFNKKNDFVNPHNWSLNPINISNLSNDDTVVLTWTGSIENENYTSTESIKISNLENAYKNIMNITFK